MERKRMAILFLTAIWVLSACSPMDSAKNDIFYGTAPLKEKNQEEVSEFKSNKERAETIKKALEEIENVKSATVVISGRTALIGLNLSVTDTEEVDRIKQECDKRAKKNDILIENTAVTSNEKITNMIESMEEEKKITA